jgi:hypothetical protein
MTTSLHAANVALIHQAHANGCAMAYRSEISDPFTGIRGVGYGESPREAFNDARVDFQAQAASVTRQALREAEAGFARIEAHAAHATAE